MVATNEDVASILIRKLERRARLDEADRRALASLAFACRSVHAGELLVRDGSTSTGCCLLVRGYACRHKLTESGGRQIVSFHMPGDLLDLPHLLLARADHNVQAITGGEVACLPSAELRRLARAHPAIGEALWRDVLIDASMSREWVVNVGRRDALSRIAHMICEFVTRAEAAGLGNAERFHLPLTQEQIADATGLTAVHVNRMLRLLDREAVIVRDGREITILDWPRMRDIAGFDISYLHPTIAAAA